MPMSKVLLAAAMAMMLTGFAGGCAGIQTQHQKIAVTCESVASAADAIAAAKVAGRITEAQRAQAEAVYRKTVPMCQPVAETLTAAAYATLTGAAAQLAAIQAAGEAK